jgi:ubiquinone/menaquinone biosynthesis C-methylase UbiE
MGRFGLRSYHRVAKLFDYRASTYDELDWVGDQRFIDFLKDVIDPSQNDIVLDVATGTGAILHSLCPSVKLGIGIDISVKMLLATKKKLKKCENVTPLVVGRGESLPFHERSFDLITCRNGLHHFLDPTLGLDEMHRVLKPAGHILLSEAVVPDTSTKSLWNYMIRLKDVGRHKLFYFTKGEFESYLSSLGFEIEDSYIYIQRVSIKNWLENGQVPKDRQQLILSRLSAASHQERTIMEIEFVDDDINLSKHVSVIKIAPTQR